MLPSLAQCASSFCERLTDCSSRKSEDIRHAARARRGQPCRQRLPALIEQTGELGEQAAERRSSGAGRGHGAIH